MFQEKDHKDPQGFFYAGEYCFSTEFLSVFSIWIMFVFSLLSIFVLPLEWMKVVFEMDFSDYVFVHFTHLSLVS